MSTTTHTVLGFGSVGDLAPVDRILHVEAGRSAQGLRNAGGTFEVFDSHFPRKPVLPGVLLLGSVTRLAAHLMETTEPGPWTFRSAERLRYRGFVQPGDSVVMTVTLEGLGPDAARCSAQATVEKRRVFTAASLEFVRGQS